MALTEVENKRIHKVLERYIEKNRPPENVRDEIDLSFRLTGQSVEIFEIRPRWNNPNEKIESSIAKATYVKSQKVWNVFWQRADLKWHRYDPDPVVNSIEKFIDIVEKDDYACFFG
jgi:hypothetical protein